MRHSKLGDLQSALGPFLPLAISLPFALRRLSQVSRSPVSTLCLLLNAKKEITLHKSHRPKAQRLSIPLSPFQLRAIGMQQQADTPGTRHQSIAGHTPFTHACTERQFGVCSQPSVHVFGAQEKTGGET